MNNQKLHLVEKVFGYLKEELGNKLAWGSNDTSMLLNGADALFTLGEMRIYVDARNEVRPTQIEALKVRKKQWGEILLAANYITPRAKKLLQEQGINYLDKAGNIWFRSGHIYIHIEGHHNPPLITKNKNRAFTKSGIKVIFSLLNDPELLNYPYRKIASTTNVSLGMIPKVIGGLQEEGFIIKKNTHQRIIRDYQGLLNRWIQEYNRKLKPSLFLERYRSTQAHFHQNWKNLDLGAGTFWGGEPAGDILTSYIKPEIFLLYTSQSLKGLMVRNRWIPDQNGDIHVYEKFWNISKNSPHPNLTPTILIYADLLEIGESRCLETAKQIHERFIQRP